MCLVSCSGDEHRAVTIAEEAEIVAQIAPTLSDKGAHQKEKRALGLVEVGYHTTHNVILVAWSYDDLGAGVEHFLVSLVHIAEQGREGIHCGE